MSTRLIHTLSYLFPSQNISILTLYLQAVTSFAFSPNGDQFAASSLDTSVAVYSLAEKNVRCLKFEQTDPVFEIDWSTKNMIAAVGKSRIVNVFEPKLHKGYSEKIVAHQQLIRSVHFSNSGNRLITGKTQSTRIAKAFLIIHRF